MFTFNSMSLPAAICIALLQGAFILLISPFLSGLSRKIRAKMHSRKGPLGAKGLFQDYRDLYKLLTRQEVNPKHSGIIFRIMPYVLIMTMLTAAMSLPILCTVSPIGGAADLITLIYIFALYRFFFSLSGVDSGSTFAGIGASRELLIGVLVEPILMLSLIVAALIAGSTNLSNISSLFGTNWGGSAPAAAVLAMFACAFAVFIEMGKIPFDLPEAEQEIQEGPLTEYSGVGLAMVSLGIKLKQAVIASIFISIFLPFGMPSLEDLGFFTMIGGMIVFAVKLVIVFTLASVYENSLMRGRFLLTSRVTWMGFGVAGLAFVFYFTNL